MVGKDIVKITMIENNCNVLETIRNGLIMTELNYKSFHNNYVKDKSLDILYIVNHEKVHTFYFSEAHIKSIFFPII